MASLGGNAATGGSASFRTTHWTQIFRARTLDSERKREALGAVLEEYWRPVYCYLRRKGFPDDRAEDLTQGFFEEIVLGRDLIPRADNAKGRFRNLLLVALERYVKSVGRAEAAQKRRPACRPLRLDQFEVPDSLHPAEVVTPEEAFAYAWASALLDRVIAEVEEDCQAAGQAVHWEAFCARILRPIMEGNKPPSLAELCAAYGIPDRVTASNMLTTIKRRFQRTLRAHVRQQVDSDEEIDGEILSLMEAFSAGCAGP